MNTENPFNKPASSQEKNGGQESHAYEEMINLVRHYSEAGKADENVAAIEDAIKFHHLKKSSIQNIEDVTDGVLTIVGTNYTVHVNIFDNRSESKITWNEEEEMK